MDEQEEKELQHHLISDKITQGRQKSFIFISQIKLMQNEKHDIINKKRSIDCALFCCKAHRKWLERKRSVGETQDIVKCFSALLEFSNCFLSALQQNRPQSRLLYLFCNRESIKFPMHYFQFSKQTLFSIQTAVLSEQVLSCSLKGWPM